MAQQNQTGKEGESEARVYLQKKGYRILHSNWHFHHYELDIVAQHGHELVVVEVKTRSEAPLLEPEDAIDGKKIKRTVAAADAYIRYFNCDMPVRFDVITILRDSSGYHIQDHIEDAFYPPCL
ncbi:MAG TPA: endonuclease [Parabacteroides sp.]|nr:endonuclease [Parabacteroides sp.]